MVLETGESYGVITRVAHDLGVGAESLRGWVTQVEVDSRHRPGISTADSQRVAARNAGHDVGRHQVTRLMALEGIQGANRVAERFTTRPGRGAGA